MLKSFKVIFNLQDPVRHDLILFLKDQFGCNMEHILSEAKLEESVLLKGYCEILEEKKMRARSKYWQLMEKNRHV